MLPFATMPDTVADKALALLESGSAFTGSPAVVGFDPKLRDFSSKGKGVKGGCFGMLGMVAEVHVMEADEGPSTRRKLLGPVPERPTSAPKPAFGVVEKSRSRVAGAATARNDAMLSMAKVACDYEQAGETDEGSRTVHGARPRRAVGWVG